MIIITGAAGFIGSCLVQYLNEQGYTNSLVLVDDFISYPQKLANFANKQYALRIPRADLFTWLAHLPKTTRIEAFFHLGARTDTTLSATQQSIFDALNLHYSMAVWQYCTQQQVPLIYASSAATYGAGEHGYEDNPLIVSKLQPLNPYAHSKNDFDKYVLQQTETPPQWYALKFFNVYGPNEYHKKRMASVIFHAYNQIQNPQHVVKLFKSHHPQYAHGEQLRDFIYVKDVVKICTFLWKNNCKSGIYNVGTGKARTFLALATAVFEALNLLPNIEFVDTPEDIRHTYQYFTEANMQKLLTTAHYNLPFYTLEQGINEYVTQFLVPQKYW